MSDNSILLGEDAGLSSCRLDNTDLRDAALKQILSSNEEILLGPLAVEVHFGGEEEEDLVQEDSYIDGYVVITTEQILFWEFSNSTSSSKRDLKVPAIHIDLHALTASSSTTTQDSETNNYDNNNTTKSTDLSSSSKPSAVYIQMSNDNDDDFLLEITLRPKVVGNDDRTRICQQLFDEISNLVSLNPVSINDDEDNPGNENALMDGMYFGKDENHDENDDDDDEMVFNESPPAATEEERMAMLQHLDNLLIVPPEFENPENDNDEEYTDSNNGQFDDAEDDDGGDFDLL